MNKTESCKRSLSETKFSEIKKFKKKNKYNVDFTLIYV